MEPESIYWIMETALFKVFQGTNDSVPRVVLYELKDNREDVLADLISLCEWIRVSKGAIVYDKQAYVSETVLDFIARFIEKTGLDIDLDTIQKHILPPIKPLL